MSHRLLEQCFVHACNNIVLFYFYTRISHRAAGFPEGTLLYREGRVNHWLRMVKPWSPREIKEAALNFNALKALLSFKPSPNASLKLLFFFLISSSLRAFIGLTRNTLTRVMLTAAISVQNMIKFDDFTKRWCLRIHFWTPHGDNFRDPLLRSFFCALVRQGVSHLIPLHGDHTLVPK